MYRLFRLEFITLLLLLVGFGYAFYHFGPLLPSLIILGFLSLFYAVYFGIAWLRKQIQASEEGSAPPPDAPPQ